MRPLTEYKICSLCKEKKLRKEFFSYKRKKGGIGYSSKCKKCMKIYNKEWWKGYKGKDLKKKYHFIVKEEVIKEYGGKCNCCGETEIIFLSIDHKNNDGAEDRKIVPSGSNFYRYLKRNNFPNKEKYQVLCFNCNMGKQVNGGICPHKK